jgi:MinD-like ATPase involved in chromosome partitioning or flagellar assembly
MTIVTVASVSGAPGATRFALGLAASWPDPSRRRIVVEADPDGGRLGAELGIGVEPGLMALALAARGGGLTGDELVERGAAAVGDWYVVPAPPSAEQTTSALAHAAGTLAATMAGDRDGSVWLVDAGRLSTRSPAMPFARAAAHVVLVSGGTFPLLQLLPHRIEALRAADCVVSVVVVEPISWSPGEVAEFVGTDVVAVLPRVSSRAADIGAMRSSSWRPWWRKVEDAAGYLAGATADVSVVPQ